MPPLFSFSEGREPAGPDSTPLLGRFRAVPGPSLGKKKSKGEFFGSVGYGSLFRSRSEEDGGGRAGEGRGDGGRGDAEADGGWRAWEWVRDVWVRPRGEVVGRVLGWWAARWIVVVGLPAGIVSLFLFLGGSDGLVE